MYKSHVGFLELELSRNDWTRGNEIGSFDQILQNLWNGTDNADRIISFKVTSKNPSKYYAKFSNGAWWFSQVE